MTNEQKKEIDEVLRRLELGEPVSTTAAELGLTPSELLEYVKGK